MEQPVIRYRYYTAWYCTNSFITSVMIIFHYQDTSDKSLVTGMRLMIALSLLVGFLVSYTFVVESINALYRTRANADGAPKWFIKGWDVIIIASIFALAICYVASYSAQTGAGFWVWYAILNAMIVLGGILSLYAIMDIRKQISLAETQSKKQLIRSQSSQLDINVQRQPSHSDTNGTNGYNSDKNESVTANSKRTLKNGTAIGGASIDTITAASGGGGAGNVDNKAVEEEREKLKRLKEGRRKLDIVMIGIIAVIALSLYSEVEQLLEDDISEAGLYDSPYPSTFSYINKFFFDFFYAVILIAWSYKKTQCCSELTPDTIFYLCCPGCDRSGAAQAHLDQLYGVTDMEDDVLGDMANVNAIVKQTESPPNNENNNNNKNNNKNNNEKNGDNEEHTEEEHHDYVQDQIKKQATETGNDNNNNNNGNGNETGNETENETENENKNRASKPNTFFDDRMIRDAIREIEEREKKANETNNNGNNGNNKKESNEGGTQRKQTNHFDTPQSGPVKENEESNTADRERRQEEDDHNAYGKRNTITNAPSTFDPSNLLNSTNDDRYDNNNDSNAKIRVAIFDFEHTMLPNHRSFYKNTVPTVKLLPMKDLILKFGGEERIDVLRQHLDYISKTHNCLLFLMTREYSEVIQIVLEKLQLCDYFVSNDYIKKLKSSKKMANSRLKNSSSLSISGNGKKKAIMLGDDSPMTTINESQTQTITNIGMQNDNNNNNNNDSDNDENDKFKVEQGMELSQRILGWDNPLMSDYTTVQSRNVAILSIMKITNCLYDEMLYIDYDLSTIEHINKINLCQTYHIKHRRGLNVTDIHAIQEKFFWQ